MQNDLPIRALAKQSIIGCGRLPDDITQRAELQTIQRDIWQAIYFCHPTYYTWCNVSLSITAGCNPAQRSANQLFAKIVREGLDKIIVLLYYCTTELIQQYKRNGGKL